jgi:hypothetical protein
MDKVKSIPAEIVVGGEGMVRARVREMLERARRVFIIEGDILKVL